MCKIRDIILIDSYKSEGVNITRHSFVVIDDTGDSIQGLDYDMVCNVLSSFKSPEQRAKKLSYPGNFPVTAKDINVPRGNNKDGYIKADQFYYFRKDLVKYKIIGKMTIEAFNDLTKFISEAAFDIIDIIDNLND